MRQHSDARVWDGPRVFRRLPSVPLKAGLAVQAARAAFHRVKEGVAALGGTVPARPIARRIQLIDWIEDSPVVRLSDLSDSLIREACSGAEPGPARPHGPVKPARPPRSPDGCSPSSPRGQTPNAPAQLAELTEREREILQLAAAGLGNVDIGRRLVIAP